MAQWIGCLSDKHFSTDKQSLTAAKAQYFRKQFNLNKTPVKAQLEITALGIFTVFINGKKVSEEFFAPGWTNYRKRILLRKYDVANLVKGENAIAVCVGDGWYAGNISIKGRRLYGEYPLEIYANLTVTFSDGSTKTIATDQSWRGGLGAIRENDFLYGEVYDSRLPHEQISMPDFVEKGFEKVVVMPDKSDRLFYKDYQPVIIKKMLDMNLVSGDRQHFIGDFGQNFAGVLRIKCVGDNGDKIIIRHGEILNDDGSLYTENLRIAKATDTIILNGNHMVEYTPTFTYHGFRYVEITCTGNAEIIDVVGCVLYNDLPRTGEFITSHPMVNQLISNIEWGMRSNFVDLPTDCPQRNERLGWSGDTQVFCRSAMFIADCKKFYEKHMLCVDDDREGGIIPDIVPFFGVARKDCSGWRDIAVVLPFNLWQFYGDKDTLMEYVPLIKDFLAQQQSTAKDFIWEFNNYNDWLNIDHQCNDAVLATLTNMYLFKLAAELFDGLGLDSSEIKDYFYKIKQSFVQKFVEDDGAILEGTQTVYSLAYLVGVINKEQAKRLLKEQFTLKNNHIHSGFIGIRFVLPVLCEVGLDDLAYELICCDTYPSWGYSIVNGATTIWERWDSYTKEKGLQEAIMNSFNHYSLGSCSEWFYEYVLGISPLEAGFKKVRIRPFVDRTGRISSAKGSFNSVSGKISVEWQKEEGGFVCNIEKPAELFAEFVIPGAYKIVQDGIEVKEFNPNAQKTTVYIS